MDFKEWATTGHPFNPLQFSVSLMLIAVIGRQRLECLGVCSEGLLIRF
jgi:hypothetical protein